MDRLRIMSKEMYSYYLKNGKVSGGCTNRRILEKRTGVEYNRLRNLFGDKREFFYEDEHVIIIRVMVADFEKGRQSLVRRGPGGMDKFRRYVIGKGADGSY